jgi:microsomal epoxide hydrolase
MAMDRVARLAGHVRRASAAPASAAGPTPQPFVLRASDAELADLQLRLERARFPEQLEDAADWAMGTELGALRRLVERWRSPDGYCWRTWEDRFNAMGPHFTLRLLQQPALGADGPLGTLHFVHRRCTSNDEAPALLLSHGWPGSVWEFHKIIPHLAQHFHVVAPSIPGYGFSDPPRRRGFSAVDAARLFHTLMIALGYQTYYAHGGDWVSPAASRLALTVVLIP